jgi:hypothetical protein
VIGDWRQQYERMVRSYQRVRVPQANTEAYTDDLYHFFQDCLHLKDWLKNDESVPAGLRARIEGIVNNSEALRIVADVANSTKHFTLSKRRRGGAEIVGRDVSANIGAKPSVTARHRIEDDSGATFVGEDVAGKAIDEWRRILAAFGLDVSAP